MFVYFYNKMNYLQLPKRKFLSEVNSLDDIMKESDEKSHF